MKKVSCYSCNADDYRILFKGSEGVELRAEHVAARKGSVNKEYRHTWVQCNHCGLVYANPIPEKSQLEKIYLESEQGGYTQEEDHLSFTYMRYLLFHSGILQKKDFAVDVGAGSGFFLKDLLELGFKKVAGYEPSLQACSKVKEKIRPFLFNEPFRKDRFAANTIDFISCFQTLEHIYDPHLLIRDFHDLLTPGGVVYCVAHDFSSLGVKILGERHPIVNAGHLTLFDKKSLRHIFSRYFDVINVFPIANKYSIKYWVSLLPFNDASKDRITNLLNILSLADIPVSLKMGNIGIIAKKK